MNPRHLPLLLMPLLAPLSAADLQPASAQPPGGLVVAQAPQFVLLGFDDNPQTGPMTWFVDYLKPRRNPAGRGMAGTFDGAPFPDRRVGGRRRGRAARRGPRRR